MQPPALAVLAPDTIRQIMENGTAQDIDVAAPSAVTLSELNARSALLGEKRIGDKAGLEAALLQHAEARLDAECPVIQDAQGMDVQETEIPEAAEQAYIRMADTTSMSTAEKAKATLDVLRSAMDELKADKPAHAVMFMELERGARLAEMVVESAEGLPCQVEAQVLSLQGAALEARLKAFDDFAEVLQTMPALAEDTATLLQNPDSEEGRAAAERLHDERLLPADLERCRAMIYKECGAALRQALADKAGADKFSDAALALVARLALETGEPPLSLLNGISLAMDSVPGAANDHDRHVLELLLQALLGSASPRDKAAYVDMLFMRSYPEGSDTALALKKALVPVDKRENMACFHAFTVSRQVLLNNIFKSLDANSELAAELSSRNFLLTPELAAKMCAKAGIEHFEYHLAHVALLQAKAIETGFLTPELPLPANFEQFTADKMQRVVEDITKRKELAMESVVKLLDMADWGMALGIPGYVEEASQQMSDAEKAKAFAEKVVLAADRFNKGFSGRSAVDTADRAVRRTGEMAGKFFSENYERSIYNTNPEFVARRVLDNCIMNLTGILDADKRLIEDENIAKNGKAVATAIRENLQKQKMGMSHPLKNQAMFGEVDKEIVQLTEYRDARLSELKGVRRPFLKHVKSMQDMAGHSETVVLLRKRLTDASEKYDKMKEVREGLSWVWPSRRSGRTRVCETVLRIAELHKNIAVLDGQINAATQQPSANAAPSGELALLMAQRDACRAEEQKELESLRGVNVRKMYGSSQGGVIPDINTVLTVMRPKAEAVLYFAKGEAQRDMKAIKALRQNIKSHVGKIRELTTVAAKVYGAEAISQTATAIRGAVLKVFVESGQSTENFSFYDPQARNAVVRQLADWGINAERGYVATMLTRGIYSMTDGKGRLRCDALRWQDAHFRKSAVLNAASDQVRREAARNAGASSPAPATLKHLNNRRQEALRRMGIHHLMEAATAPGGGFEYDYTRGVALKLGTTIDGDDMSLVKPIVGLPVAMKIGGQTSDTLVVRNAGDGAFTVTLKSEKAMEIALALGIDIGLASATLEGSVSGARAGGIYMRFPSRETCERFLVDFMNPKSSLHNAAYQGERSWMAAEDIRMVSGYSGSASLALGFSLGNFSPEIVAGVEATLASLKVGVNVIKWRSTSYNAKGRTDTVSRQLSVEVDASLLTGTAFAEAKRTLVRGIAVGKRELEDANAVSATLPRANIAQTFNFHSGEGGLTSETGMKMEMRRGNRNLLDTLVLMQIPRDKALVLLKNEAQRKALAEAWAAAPQDALVSVNWQLKPENLDQARVLAVRARVANSEERKVLMKQYHDMLGRTDAYEPVSLFIEDKTQHDIAYNNTIGGALLEYKRETTFATMRGERFSLKGV